MEQWGSLVNGTATFPVAFTDFVATGDTVIRTGSNAQWQGESANVTLTTITVRITDYKNIGRYIAVGC